MTVNRRSVLLGVAALVALLWTVAPLIWVLLVSGMYHQEFATYPTPLFPHVPTLSNYTRLFGFAEQAADGTVLPPIGHGPLILAGLKNSVVVALGVMVLTLLIAAPAAYVLGRVNMRFKTAGLLTILATRALPPVATTIPFYALYLQLGLSGTQLGLIIAHLTITVPLIIWIGSSFFTALPPSLERLARVDGCSRFEAFYRVVLPASLPAIVTMAVIAFLVSWDEFTFALILTTGTTAQTFPPALASMFFQISVPTEVAAATILGLLPPLLLAALFQRYIRQVNFVTLY